MRKWRWLTPLGVLLLALAAAAGPGAAAGETVELSGETVEYDVNRRVSVVTGGSGAPATLVSGRLTLSGERLEYAEATGQVKVEGGVRLEQSEPDRFVLTARTLTCDLKARTARAQGEVRLVSGKAVATAAAAFFDSKERQVVLSGDPEVRSDGNVLRGKEIVFFLAGSKIKAQGGSRVTVPVEQAGEKGE
ncbi:MAG: LptA/OstA family protein [Bacillota bacterium]|nr:LptA/OstA family protein [Bacillota bacterium]